MPHSYVRSYYVIDALSACRGPLAGQADRGVLFVPGELHYFEVSLSDIRRVDQPRRSGLERQLSGDL